MMRCVLSLLFTMGVGTMGIAGAAFAADPPAGQTTHQAANQAPSAATPSTDNARIKRFAQDRLLTSRTHLDDASRLH